MNDDTRHLIRLNPERAREIKKRSCPVLYDKDATGQWYRLFDGGRSFEKVEPINYLPTKALEAGR